MGRDGRQLRIEPCSFIRAGFSYLFFSWGVVGIKKGVYLWGQTNTHNMTTEQRNTIRQVQAVLLSIENGTPKFFNVAQYEKLGLVESKTSWAVNAVGNKVDMGSTFYLTPKAKAYLNVIV